MWAADFVNAMGFLEDTVPMPYISFIIAYALTYVIRRMPLRLMGSMARRMAIGDHYFGGIA